MSKLYHYVHCPFCVRVRMSLGWLKIPYQSNVLAYDDESTPLGLTSVKMLPIFVSNEGVARNESLEIIQLLDKNQTLSFDHYESHKVEIEKLLSEIGSPVHNLAMPYWIWSPEFDQQSRAYFQAKKELKRGPFYKLVERRDDFIKELATIFNDLSPNLTPFFKSNQMSIVDIMLASHLWGLYVVPEFQFPKFMHDYLMRVKELCHFNYHQDFWQNENFIAKRSL